ncbi:MAG: DUF3604 domain-containing protein, partial [Halieaceae bacterium]|nr:DUF3604 domain-containing protein [Halieaceae bacterium]
MTRASARPFKTLSRSAVSLISLLIMPAFGEGERPYTLSEEREHCDQYQPLRRPHFGDTHVHTAYSFDASSQDTRNTPYDAYDFARGGRMGIQPYVNDEPLRHIQLDRPLDFTAVTDHSEFLGEINICTTPGIAGYWHPVCIAHRNFPELSFATFAAYGLVRKERWGLCGEGNAHCYSQARSRWRDMQDAAEQAYDRSAECRFTSFVGYEWTGTVGPGKNLHHNVVFKNAKVPDRALSWIESPSVMDLWSYLEQECVAEKEGCDAVSIPHNPNLSGGLMFQTAAITRDQVVGKITANEARRRRRWQPLFEIMQHKGSSECDIRAGWTEDEFCGFEKLPYDSFGGKNTGIAANGQMDWLKYFAREDQIPVTQLPDANNYVRWALKEGLRQQQALGINPFKFGLIGSTDTHIAAPGLTSERNHPGHGGAGMGAGDGVPAGLPDELEYGPGGLAVLWAEENTRDSLFAAMRRREAYATSGTRPIVRFFGGWEYQKDLCESPELVALGYEGGVPMGGDLLPRPVELAHGPRFAVSAVQDAGTAKVPGTALQRVQIIKGWYEAGELKERVLDVAGGANNASVDLESCETHGSGHQNLCRVWQDDSFNAAVPAFYYTRVLENPTCRWSQRICAAARVQCGDPDSVPAELQ